MPSSFTLLSELNQNLPWVAASPKDAGVIETLCVRPKEGERRFVDSIQVSIKGGIKGDRWSWKTWMHLEDGSPDPRLQICILNSRILKFVRPDPTVLHPGDNIITDMDLSEENLPAGQHLKVGSCLIEVSDVFNTACAKWQARYGADALRWVNQSDLRPLRLRGVLAKVIQSGTIHKTDVILKTT